MSTAQQSPRIVIVVMGLVLLAGTLVGWGMLGEYLDQRAAQKTFAETTGTVLESSIRHRKHDAHMTGSGAQASRSTYYPYIKYTYDVDGKSYTARRYTYFYQGNEGKARAQGIIEAYAKGARVSVFYDPADPQEAVLDNGPAQYAGRMAFFFGLFYCVTGGILFLSVRYIVRNS